MNPDRVEATMRENAQEIASLQSVLSSLATDLTKYQDGCPQAFLALKQAKKSVQQQIEQLQADVESCKDMLTEVR